ncbi:nuclear pore complex protein Nup133-like [Asterias rubens]|uniref:nuclear pore complex protein Nup133-like n=1 Tax=Asterias rubens TaxID=7604 RepID=UPI001454F773|nr:nuclear pore complex protein Nup133-like [Asterias rubens]
MYTPRSSSSKGKYTPFSTGRVGRTGSGLGSASSRRSSAGIFAGGTGARRSPFAFTSGAGTRSPAFGNRSILQTSVIAETAHYVVENYGSSVPVLITEALAMADRSTSVSVHIHPSGWACVVCGRRLFVWRYKHTHIAKATFCKELSLPPSELSHKADLVCLIPASRDNQSVTVMAVSPEGIIRYWPNIASEGTYSESSADLNGEECFSLTQFEPYGCILATTTNQLLLLTLAGSNTQNVVSCHPLKPSQGMFARVSSLFFGSQRPQSSSTLQRVLAGGEEDGQGVLLVLEEDVLQKWLVTEPGSEKVVMEIQLGSMIKKQFARELGSSAVDSIKAWMLDVQIVSDGALLLVAAMNSAVSNPILHYALATVPLSSNAGAVPEQLKSFKMLSLSARYQITEEESLLDYHLLLAAPSSITCHIYSRKTVICCLGIAESNSSFENVDFNQPGDGILGAGSCDSTTLFFTNNHGLVTISTTQQEPSFLQDVSLADQSLRLDQSLIAESPAQPVDVSVYGDDKMQGLKAAFLQACRQNLSQAEAIVEELFPAASTSSMETGSAIDLAVAKLSQEVIDDFPASDPRWAESIPQDSASATSSLILLHQLEDKMKAHDHLLSFLQNVGVWDRLHSVIVRECPLVTHLLLCEHAEKLAAAMALRSHHTMFPNLVDGAISKVLDMRGQKYTPSGLTPQDVFYREVSGIHEIIGCLVEQEKDILSSELAPSDIVCRISNINIIIQGMIKDAWHLRQSKALVYQSHGSSLPTMQYIPWTASTGPKGIRMLLTQQHRVTIERGIPNSEDIQSRGALYQQIMELTDLILEGYVTQLDSISLSSGEENAQYEELEQKYHQERSALIKPLIDHGQYERAASLGEKYCDFGILVSLCELTENEERLQRYMNQFATKGFSDFVFKYYMDEGKRSKLLSQPFSQHAELSEFLQAHDHLSWLHHLQVNDYSKAQETLKRLAAKETLSVAKKKTLLSLSKLSALAGEASDTELEDINTELDIILHQELLPRDLVQSMELFNKEEDLPVLDPEQLIWLYISNNNTNSNEYDFKKALDLLRYIPVDDEKYEHLRLSIWCKVILKNDWSAVQGSGVDPLQNYEDTIFFKTARMILDSNDDLQYYLPNMDDLLSSQELTPLQSNSNFQYILRAGYEQMQRM